MKTISFLALTLASLPISLISYSHKDYTKYIERTALKLFNNVFDAPLNEENYIGEKELKKVPQDTVVTWLHETAAMLDADIKYACQALPTHFEEVKKLHLAAQRIAHYEKKGDFRDSSTAKKFYLRNGAELQKLYKKQDKEILRIYTTLCVYELLAHFALDISYYDTLPITGKTFAIISLEDAINQRPSRESAQSLGMLETCRSLVKNNEKLPVPFPLLEMLMIGFTDAPHPHSLDTLFGQK